MHSIAVSYVQVVLPLIALSAIGWLVYVIGFGLFNNRRSQAAIPEDYPYYAAAVFGPFVYIGAVAHAALWRQISSIVGSIIAVLSVVYFTAMGYILHLMGTAIYEYYHNPEFTALDNSVTTMFSGSFLACLFWAGVVAAWPWYKTAAD